MIPDAHGHAQGSRAEVLDLEEARSLSEPPHSTQAEQAVLGSVLKNPLALSSVLPFLKPHHFYVLKHQHIYAAMAALFERAAAIDYHTLGEELSRQGTYAPAGGLVYLAELNLATPSSAHIEHYARIVLEHATRRRYLSAAQQVAELAWNRGKDLDQVKHLAEAAILGASSETLSRRAILAPAEWTADLLDYLDQARSDGLAGVSTGLRDLDTMTLGLSPGLYLLAAATGTGKTALAGQIALHVAEQHGPVVFVSMELTAVDLAVRLVAVLTNIQKEQLVTARLSDAQLQQVAAAVERLAASKLHLVAGSGYTSSDVRAYALQVQATERARPALLVVDYVQLLRDVEGDGRTRERNVSAAVRGLKDLSGELEVPVLALVQLNRNRATRADKRPQLADLRESGDLENTADSVLGLYRDEIDHPETKERGLAELSVLKKRQLGGRHPAPPGVGRRELPGLRLCSVSVIRKVAVRWPTSRRLRTAPLDPRTTTRASRRTSPTGASSSATTIPSARSSTRTTSGGTASSRAGVSQRDEGRPHRPPPGRHLAGAQGRRSSLSDHLVAGAPHPRGHPPLDWDGPSRQGTSRGQRLQAHARQAAEYTRRAEDRALLLLGFAGAFRRSELVGLDVADLEFSSAGLVVTLRRAKTDQEGRSRRIGITYGSSERTYPVRSLQAWLEAARIADGPVFRSVDKAQRVQSRRLSDQAVARIVKRRAVAVGLDPERYAGHSLRAGLATSAAAGGASERVIMAQTGHRSADMVRRYIREGNLWRENAASLAGL